MNTISDKEKNRINELQFELDEIEKSGFSSKEKDIQYCNNLVEIVSMAGKYCSEESLLKCIEDIEKIVNKNKE